MTLGDEDMKVHMDTGSSRLIVWGSACTSSWCEDNPRYYGHKGQRTGDTEDTGFVSQEAFGGEVWRDSFSIQGVRGAVKKQRIGKFVPSSPMRSSLTDSGWDCCRTRAQS